MPQAEENRGAILVWWSSRWSKKAVEFTRWSFGLKFGVKLHFILWTGLKWANNVVGFNQKTAVGHRCLVSQVSGEEELISLDDGILRYWVKLSCHHRVWWPGVRRKKEIVECLNCQRSQILSWLQANGIEELNSPDEGWVKVWVKLSWRHFILWPGVRRTKNFVECLSRQGSQMLSWPQVGGVEELNSPDEGWVKVLSEVILPSYHIVVRSEEDELYSRTFKQPGITDA